MRHAAKGQWGGGMDLQGSIRQANSLRRVGALFATRTGTLWPNARNGTVRNVAKEDTRFAIAHIHEVEEGYFIDVMMDTGADPSVVDRGTVQKMNIPYSTKYSQVYGLGRTALAVCSTACVAIYVGDGRPLEHEIEVLDTNNRVVILGRMFLACFKNTTFDWENMRVRLGGC